MARRTPLVALLVLTLAVSGCAATPTPVASSTPASAASTPTPTPTPVGPLAAFDGDCAQVLTAADREAILGPGSLTADEWFAENYPDAPRSVGADATLLAGGVSCRWMPAAEADLPEGMEDLWIEIYPEEVVPTDVRTALAEPRCDPQYDSSGCRLARSVDGTWVMARAGWLLYEPPVDVLSLALDTVAANLAHSQAPVAATPTEQWWAIPECDAFGDQLGLSEMLGEGYHSGYWEGSAQFEDLILAGAGVRQFCQYSSAESIPDGYEFMILSVTVEPGGALTWDDGPVDDEVSVDIPGAEQAFSGSTSGVRATDGTNTVTVASEGDDADALVAERVLAELSR